MATIKKDYSSAGIPGNYERGNPIPLDTTEVWYSLSDAEKYASTGETAYVGQTLKVVDADENNNVKSVKSYVIADTKGTLKELANDDSKLSLSGGTVNGTITATKFVGPLEGNADTATTATKLSSSDGSATQPVYFKDGKPVATTHTLEKSVPSDAKFTDTTYTFNGAVSTIKDDNLAANMALISDSFGKVAVSDVTSTELGYLSGVTSSVQEQLDGKSNSGHKHSASGITSGTLNTDRIPELDAGKITSGTLNTDRIPELDAGKITSGTLSSDRIPNLSAIKITSGTLPIARGGTGATSAADAICNLGAGRVASGYYTGIEYSQFGSADGGTPYISADLYLPAGFKPKMVTIYGNVRFVHPTTNQLNYCRVTATFFECTTYVQGFFKSVCTTSAPPTTGFDICNNLEASGTYKYDNYYRNGNERAYMFSDTGFTLPGFYGVTSIGGALKNYTIRSEEFILRTLNLRSSSSSGNNYDSAGSGYGYWWYAIG